MQKNAGREKKSWYRGTEINMRNIQAERLIVRSFKPEDWTDLREYLSREEVMRFEGDWNTSEDGMKGAAKDLSGNAAFWAVELRTTGKMIGHVYFAQTQPEVFRTWMLGYIFNNEYYGKGYATEACKGLMDHAFRNMGVHRVIAKCSPENVPSWKLLERLGMRREGHSLRCAAIKRTASGEPIWWDEYLYAILKDEWKNSGVIIDENR